MSQARKRHTNNTLIGAGECFIDVLDEKVRGERYLGDTSSGVLRIESEEITVVAGDGATPRALARVVSNIVRSFEVNLQDLSPENLALFVLGDDGVQKDAATRVARNSPDAKMTVEQGRWYQLGVNANCPAGCGSVKKDDFSVHNSENTGNAFYTATTFHPDGRVKVVGDYTLDDKAGRMYIEPGKRITASNPIYVAHVPVAQTLKTVVASAHKQIKATFRYVENATQGRGNNYYAPEAIIRPGGDLALKDRTAAQSLTLIVDVLQADGTVAPLYINQQPASA